MARPSDPNARVDLLAAAEKIFVQRGLDDSKVEDITDLAGRSKGSFYLHFASKEEAFRQVVESMIERLSALLDCEAKRDLAATPSIEALFEAWIASGVEMFSFVWRNRGVMRLVLRGGLSSTFNHLSDEFAERVRRFILDGLRKGVERGLYRADLDLDVTSLALAGAYDRIARQVVEAEQEPDFRHILRAVDSALLGGVGNDAVRTYFTQPLRAGTRRENR